MIGVVYNLSPNRRLEIKDDFSISSWIHITNFDGIGSGDFTITGTIENTSASTMSNIEHVRVSSTAIGHSEPNSGGDYFSTTSSSAQEVLVPTFELVSNPTISLADVKNGSNLFPIEGFVS